MSEQEYYDERLKKLKNLENKGINAFPQVNLSQKDSSANILKKYEKLKEESKDEVLAAGRILSMRNMGKIAFAHILDDEGRIQIVLLKDFTKNFELLDYLDIGDFVSARGNPFRTQKGELSIKVKELKIVSKALRPLPEKFHGLKDDETRYRKRYLDLIMNPGTKEKFAKRTQFLKSLRSFLDRNDFLEVQTPILQTMYGGALAEPFKTHYNALNCDFYLRIAPELYLKRLMVAGYEKVYEMGPNFRNEGFDSSHVQEIPNALEFYWAYQTYEGLMKFCEEMLLSAFKETLGTTKITYKGQELDFKPPYPRVTFRDAVLKNSGVDIDKFGTYEKLVKEIKRLKVKDVNVEKCKNYGALLDEFYKRTVRPKIVNPTFITNYPTAMKPLAKRNEKDPTKSNSFQLLAIGWELCNAYDELNDPLDQRKRLEEQQGFIKEGDKEAHPLDEDFIEAMEYGMPPIAGFGLGTDRFITLMFGFDNIRESVFFPPLKPETAAKP